jgi:folate-dependent phosphoribosylglycinamide formyltransferase PurN
VAALAARVLKEEHRIYPQALGELARSLQSLGGCERHLASPPAR